MWAADAPVCRLDNVIEKVNTSYTFYVMVLRKRLNLKGSGIVFITTTVFNWKPVLIEPKVIEIIIDEVKKLKEFNNISIFSYVIMPHHIHLLLGVPKLEQLSKSIQAFKSISSRRVKKFKLKELEENAYRLWMPRFDEFKIYSEKQLKIKMEYIHNNPVRAGFTENAEEWRYSSASDWLTEKSGLVSIDKEYNWLIDSGV